MQRDRADLTQAPDGTRKDNEGKIWYPPLGNGVKAAYDALESGNAQPTENGSSPAATQSADSAQTEAQKLAAKAREEGVDSAAAETDGPAPAAGTTNGVSGEDLDAIERGTAGLAVGAAAGIAIGTTTTPSSSGTAAGAAAAGETASVAASSVTSGASSVPVAPTKPGPPASDLVFDHPPTEGEKKLAEEIERRSGEHAR